MTKPNWPAGRILLIDDDQDLLKELKTQIETILDERSVTVDVWRPEPNDSVTEKFIEKVGDRTILVVTDYDLTKNGPAGFFGTSIVSWCQNRLIPVGDYSRGSMDLLPKLPNSYEFRFDSKPKAAASEIVAVYEGFSEIRNLIEINQDLLEAPSIPSLLARLLGRSSLAPHFSQYNLQLGANSRLGERLPSLNRDARSDFLSYVIGHFLFNCILRFPGPIIDMHTLCAYHAVDSSCASMIADLYNKAAYHGPFSKLHRYFWREDVDSPLDSWAETSDAQFEKNIAAYRRAIIEDTFSTGPLLRFQCPRCQGEKGGFKCLLSGAVVCEWDQCSVSSSVWIPEGADLLRIERERFDEQEPMLGR